MHLDLFTPGTYLIIVLLGLTIDVPLTVRHIFEDNHNWAGFRLAEKDNLRDVEIKEVNKMLSWKDESRGFFTYECESCGTQKTVYFGCNSRICTRRVLSCPLLSDRAKRGKARQGTKCHRVSKPARDYHGF
jgi:hypothetical protein